MRIIGGSLGGRRIKAPPGSATRPTSDRVREAIFNILGAPPADARVLDAFAGAGTLGLEALSRGASEAHFIDSSPVALRCLSANISALGARAASRIHRGDAIRVVRRWTSLARKTARRAAEKEPGSELRFHWLFLDPPYAADLAMKMLELLADGALLGENAVVVVEHDRRRPPAKSYGCLMRTDQRRYGDTEVSFYSLEETVCRSRPVHTPASGPAS